MLREIAGYIHDGAKTFLTKEYIALSVFVVGMCVLVGALFAVLENCCLGPNVLDKTEKVGHADNVTQEEPEVVYRAPPVRYFKPMKGWDGSSRRVIQYAFSKLGSPTELNDANNNVWRGPDGTIKQIQDYVMVSGWRSAKTIRSILTKTLHDPDHDAGIRIKMRDERQRKMSESDARFVMKSLRHGSGMNMVTAYLNHDRIHKHNQTGLSESTIRRTMQKKYDAIVHRRQKKPTGSDDAEAKWTRARLQLSKQFLYQVEAAELLTPPQPSESALVPPVPSPPDPSPPDPSPPDPSPPSDPTLPPPPPESPLYPDAPFQVGDRVVSRRKCGQTIFSSNRFLGLVHDVIRSGGRHSPVWSFKLRFNDGHEEIVEGVERRMGVKNIMSSTIPLPIAVVEEPCVPESITTEPQVLPPPLRTYTTNLSPADVRKLREFMLANGADPEWVPVYLQQVLWIDEKHMKCILGLANDFEWLFAVDPEDNDKPLALKNGGVREDAKPRTEGKYIQEARAVFGVSMTLDGEGRRMTLFNYTGKKVCVCVLFIHSALVEFLSFRPSCAQVVGVKAYKKAVKGEVLRVHMLDRTGKSGIWKDAGDLRDGGAYKARYGDDWEIHVKEKLGKGSSAIVCVTEIMDHVVQQGNIMFRDTPFANTWYVGESQKRNKLTKCALHTH